MSACLHNDARGTDHLRLPNLLVAISCAHRPINYRVDCPSQMHQICVCMSHAISHTLSKLPYKSLKLHVIGRHSRFISKNISREALKTKILTISNSGTGFCLNKSLHISALHLYPIRITKFYRVI